MLAYLLRGPVNSRFVICDDKTNKRIKMTPVSKTIRGSIENLRDSNFIPYDSKLDHLPFNARLRIDKSDENNIEFIFTFGYDELNLYEDSVFANNMQDALSLVAEIIPEDYYMHCYDDLSKSGIEKLIIATEWISKKHKRPYNKVYFEIKNFILANATELMEKPDFSRKELGILIEPKDFICGLQFQGIFQWIRTFEDENNKGTYGFKVISFDYCKTKTGFDSHQSALFAGKFFNGYDFGLLPTRFEKLEKKLNTRHR